MMNDVGWWIAGVVGVVLALTAIGWLIRFSREVQRERARELFYLQQERLGERFREAGQRTGKPRGLRWSGCLLDGDWELVRERRSHRLVALARVVLTFEPVEGGDMEDLPAAHLPRHATAIFMFVRGEWLATGRVVMNLSPDEVLEKFSEELEPAGGHR